MGSYEDRLVKLEHVLHSTIMGDILKIQGRMTHAEATVASLAEAVAPLLPAPSQTVDKDADSGLAVPDEQARRAHVPPTKPLAMEAGQSRRLHLRLLWPRDHRHHELTLCLSLPTKLEDSI